MIKAVFFDIDGTLVSFNTHQVPQSTIDAISLLHEKGIKVFIATGRHLHSINNLGTLEFDGYITINGGYCTIGKDQVLYKHSIPHKDIELLMSYQEESPDKAFPCMLVQENGLYMNFKNDRVKEVLDLLNFPEPPTVPLREMPEEEVFQIIGFFSEEEEEDIMKVLTGCETTRWTPLFTDIIPRGGSKHIGIDKIIEYFGFTLEETMAFGDGGNDISMLKHVGLGVAMGNAEDQVKEAADYTTTTVDDNGIMNALKYLKIV